MSIAFPLGDRAPERTRLVVEARALLERGNEQARLGEPEAAIARYEEGLGLLAGQQHPLVADLLCRLGAVHTRLGRTDDGEELFGRSLEMANRCDHVVGQANAVNGLAVVAQGRAELDLAEWHYRRAARLAAQAGAYGLCGTVEQGLGALANMRGELDRASVHYRKSVSAFERSGDTEGVCRVLNDLGMLEVDLRRYEHAQATLDRALELARQREDPVMTCLVQLNRSEALIAAEEWREAGAACKCALALADERGDRLLRAEALRLLAVIHREGDRLDQAHETLLEAHLLARLSHDRLLAAEIVAEQGEICLRSGQSAEARELWTKALAEFQALDSVIDVAALRKKLRTVEEARP